MANLGFSLRSAFGLIPKTEKIESQKNALQDEYDRLNSYVESEELKEYQELKTLIESNEFISNKKNIAALNFKSTEEYQKEVKFIKLKKDKRFVNFFKVLASNELTAFNETETSDELKRFRELNEYLSSNDHKDLVKDFSEKLNLEVDKAKQLKALDKSKEIKDYYKTLNSVSLKNYNNLKGSSDLDEYNQLKEFTSSSELSAFKKDIAQQLVAEKNKTKEVKQLRNNPAIKQYLKNKNKEELEKPEALTQLEELQAYLKSSNYQTKLNQLQYKNTEEFKKEEKFKALQKDRRFKDYFKFIASPLFKHYSVFKDSDKLKEYEDLKAYVNSSEYQQAISEYTYKNTDEFKLEKEFESLKKSSRITTWQKYQKSKPYLLFKEIENSEALAEYQELEDFIGSDKFKEFKEYMLDKDKWKKTDDYQKEIRYNELAKSENIKWYFSIKDSKKFDELKAWNLTFEDDFTSGKVDDEKWMNSYFWGKMLLNDRYVVAGDRHFYTDNKNIEHNGTTVKIITKKEQTQGKVWHPVHGFSTQEFGYTSGMLSTAHSFRQLYGKIEAKVKLNGEYPVYQAFWLKGEKIMPEIDVFKFNMDKKNRFQMSNIWGEPTDFKSVRRKTEKLNGSGFTKDYFIYSLEWNESKLTWKVNGVEVFSCTENIPTEPLYLLLSAGIQKEPQQEIVDAAFEIDWVRCYEKA